MMRVTIIVFAALALAGCSLDYEQLANCQAEDYCEGDVLHTCGPGGDAEVSCPLTCVDDPGPARCTYPSNDVPISTEPGLADIVTGKEGAELGRILYFDTDSGEISQRIYFDPDGEGMLTDPIREAGEGVISGIHYERRMSEGATAPPLAIFTFASVSIEVTGGWFAGGDHAFVVVSQSTVDIAGIVDVGAGLSVGRPGPGGGPGGTAGDGFGVGGGGGGLEGSTINLRGGGAGGSFGGLGGAGGSRDGLGGVVGASYGSPELIPLEGGAGGGAGAGASGEGGPGGGAIQIVARESIAVVGSSIIAPGGGGNRGQGDLGMSLTGGGGGGGSGGAILLEAPMVRLRGALAVNGGGGGGGAAGDPGERGVLAVSAPGGMEGLAGGRGGDGNDGSGVGGAGGSGMLGGGGGGGAGRIRVNTLTGSEDFSGFLVPDLESGLSTVGALLGVD